LSAFRWTHQRHATEAEAAALVSEDRRAQKPARRDRQRLQGRDRPAGADGRDAPSAAALTGVTLYEPAEMVMAARAGTPMAEIERILAERGHMLPFEPPDHRTLLGSAGEPRSAPSRPRTCRAAARVNAGRRASSLIGAPRQRARRGGEVRRAGDEERHRLDLVKLVAAPGHPRFLTE
jgi:glycolate oxidase FAD binding subunit